MPSYQDHLNTINSLDLTAVTRERLSNPRADSSGASTPTHLQPIFTPSQHPLRAAFAMLALTAAAVVAEKTSDASATSAIGAPTAVTAAGPAVER
jgi:hypothetical protein